VTDLSIVHSKLRVQCPVADFDASTTDVAIALGANTTATSAAAPTSHVALRVLLTIPPL
jgi:hypothetical protein